MRGATLITVNDHMGVHHSIFTDAVMANSVPQILYKSCKIQKVVLHKQKNRLASMAVITTDASGNWGCGGYCECNWFQVQWPQNTADLHITIKELIPIVLALGLWGGMWVGKTIQLRCDNAAAVAIINSGDSRDAEAMHLRRCMAFIAAKFDLNCFASHINTLADELSRNKLTNFMSDASPWPTPIPPELLDLIMVQKPDWRSPDWTRLWSSTFRRD